MKKLLLVLLFITSITSFSQIPTGYYDTATGTGYALKTQLYSIILGHTDNGYSGLWTTYQTSDRDIFYENDNTILDIYSEDPTGVDPYNYTYSTDQCGTYADEGDCYNREHIIPQSVFSEQSPMRNDAHFVIPTDGKVNGFRSNYPHGNVASATIYTSDNGTLVGTSDDGYSGGPVCEPIDEFKGDIARMYFYFATRYENLVSGWSSYGMFNGTSDQVFSEPFLTILMTWHTNDPVSTREIDRNNAIYARQNNRNPFIDHPEYVAQIWSATADTQAPTAPTNLTASNITNTTVDLTWTASTDNVGVTSYDIFVDGSLFDTSVSNSATLTGLTINTSYAITVYAKDAFGNTSTVSNTENITTTNIIDTTDPTVPTALIVSNETSSTLDLAWTASTDDQAVKDYDVYLDGSYLATTTLTTYTITSLTAETTYSLFVLARDTSDNVSVLSVAVDGTTTAIPSFCGSETFTNSNAPTGSYGNNSFTGDNGVTWTYVQSRDDEGYSITGTGLMLRRSSDNSKVTSSTVSSGIGDFTCSLLKGFTGAGNRQVA
ncbi:endonuclease, partial [Lutibacter sp.]|uniref:endonuclease n=1 Tax=Lutibacter sp. TaxID=1925666 RepID=UPI0034A09A72